MYESNDEDKDSLNEDDKIILEINRNLRDAKSHQAQWRTEAINCYNMYASDQWDENDRKKLEDEQRVPITFNRIVRTINACCGLEVQNRQQTRFLPRENSDNGLSEVINGAFKWARDICDAEDEDSHAFNDNLIC